MSNSAPPADDGGYGDDDDDDESGMNNTTRPVTLCSSHINNDQQQCIAVILSLKNALEPVPDYPRCNWTMCTEPINFEEPQRPEEMETECDTVTEIDFSIRICKQMPADIRQSTNNFTVSSVM